MTIQSSPDLSTVGVQFLLDGVNNPILQKTESLYKMSHLIGQSWTPIIN